METISFDDFVKVQIKIGKILSAERVEGSDKLLKLSVDFGAETEASSDLSLRADPAGAEEGVAIQSEGTKSENATDVDSRLHGNDNAEPQRIIRQIIAGIGKAYAPEDLVGKECPFVYNLAPRMLKGLESQGMILCPDNAGSPCLLHPDKEIPAGSVVK